MKVTFSLAVFFVITVMIMLPGCDIHYGKITLETLLKEMTDREQLAKFPEPEYTVKQFSSYDRSSRFPEHYTWFANQDNNNFIRTESNNNRRELVLFDAEGPGALVRIWATFNRYNKNGILRFYFDHESDPGIEGAPMELISGGKLIGAPLSFSVSEESEYEKRGHNLYLPVPYSKHLKITYESDSIQIVRDSDTHGPGYHFGRGEVFYYQINYRTYKPGVKVKTFEMEDITTYSRTIQETLHKIENCDRDFADLELQTVSFSKKLYPGWKEHITMEGERALRKLQLKLKADNLEQALRSTVIKASFDGQQTIWGPVGDFSGAGYKIIPARTWYQEVSPDGTLEVYWVMPFRNECILTFLNYGDQYVEIQGKITTSQWKWDNRSMYFGSSWYQNTRINTREKSDINYTTLNGQGVFVGDGVTLFDCSPGWWGEGDEKIYIDNEEFPSHFGTGTEDYYGYAWCRPEKFIHPFIAQPEGSGNLNAGYTVNMRYRTIDAIPFHERLQFHMEMWHWQEAIMNHAPVTYWYIKPGGHCKIQPDYKGVKEEVVFRRDQIIQPVMDKRNIIKGEDLIVSSITGDGSSRITPTPLPDRPTWINLLMWHNAKKGDEITYKFLCDNAGTYNIILSSYKEKGSVCLGFLINARTVLPSYSIGADAQEVQIINLHRIALKEGYNELSVRILDSSDEDGLNYGIDYLKFKEVLFKFK